MLNDDVTTEAKLEAIRKIICFMQSQFMSPLLLYNVDFHPYTPCG